jgi:hypothetical protein
MRKRLRLEHRKRVPGDAASGDGSRAPTFRVCGEPGVGLVAMGRWDRVGRASGPAAYNLR